MDIHITYINAIRKEKIGNFILALYLNVPIVKITYMPISNNKWIGHRKCEVLSNLKYDL